MTTAVVMEIVNNESKIRCPNHNPMGFARPSDNCMACTDDLRSRDTKREESRVHGLWNAHQQGFGAAVVVFTIAAPKKTSHLKASDTRRTLRGKLA